MSSDSDLRLVGVGSSPYTRKLRGALRFRRLPFRFVIMGSKDASALPERPLPLVPYLVLPAADGGSLTAISDTTPILIRKSAFLFGVLAAFAALLLATRGDLLMHRPATLYEWSLWTTLMGGALCSLVCRPSRPRPEPLPPKADTPC